MGTTCDNEYKALDANSSGLSAAEYFLSNFPLNLDIFAVFPLHLDSFMSHCQAKTMPIFA